MTCKNTTLILSQLRQLMRNPAYVSKPIDAYIVPSGDAHQSEYTASCDQRRAFISGFTGSMGTAIITTTAAALWVDSRYYLQAEVEIDTNWTLMKVGLPKTPKEGKWLVDHFSSETSENKTEAFNVGVDASLYNSEQWKSLDKQLVEAGHALVPVEKNLVDIVWGQQRPHRPCNPVTILEEKWTGKSHIEKLISLREKLKEKNCAAIVLTALDDVAYLLNLRGDDIEFNPVFFSFVIVSAKTATLFINKDQIKPEVASYLAEANVTVKSYEECIADLKQVSESLGAQDKVWLPNSCSQAIASCVPADKVHKAITPVTMAKCIKNDVEIAGMEASHIRDGAALCSFLCWLEKEAPKGSQTEISAADYLANCRAKQQHFRGLSFETISSVGSNAAIVHYKPAPETDKTVTDKEIYLVDSGGHYSDGTTDVTRTVHFGTPTAQEIDAFTRVLKGHIAMAAAVFPDKTKGYCLDAFARQSLWSVGLNYGHGTGHGVGMYLNVHEEPTHISCRVYGEDPGVMEGMFLSDEPGYYEDGKFGIRTESILRAVVADTPHRFNDEVYLTFKNVTMAPIQTKLIDKTLLSQAEVDWLNTYHTEVLDKVGSLLKEQSDTDTYEWLLRETKHI